MSVIRMGSSTKYADGWSHVFGGGKQGQGSARGKKSAGPAKAAKQAAASPGDGADDGATLTDSKRDSDSILH